MLVAVFWEAELQLSSSEAVFLVRVSHGSRRLVDRLKIVMHQQPFNQLTNKGIFCEGLKRPLCLTNSGIVYWCRWWFQSIWNRSESKLNIKHHWQIKGPNSLAAKPPPIGIVLSTVYVSTSPSGIVLCPSIVTAMPLRQRSGRTGTVHGWLRAQVALPQSLRPGNVTETAQEMDTHTKYRNKLKGTKSSWVPLGETLNDTLTSYWSLHPQKFDIKQTIWCG